MYEYRLISNEKVESQDRLHENTELSNKENQNFYQNPPACNSSGSGDLQEKSIAYNEPSEYCLADFGRLPFTVTEFLSAKVAKARRDKRIWDKRDFCLYCYENVTNFSRHLLRKHNSEVAVKQFMNMRLGSIERKNFIDLLRKKRKLHFSSTKTNYNG
ncbi:hypothetical protein NQ314_014876 [Rhamnusium bicolor]|uniref:Uncharacterized protein n=1 Tax=Rhamnusium bicolor TaxID=1586634 RepID=A0AAV8X053_9CUCU|nr:hypothetical protein NQ314_014876 [Rhamnusium bicolor]